MVISHDPIGLGLSETTVVVLRVSYATNKLAEFGTPIYTLNRYALSIKDCVEG